MGAVGWEALMKTRAFTLCFSCSYSQDGVADGAEDEEPTRLSQ